MLYSARLGRVLALSLLSVFLLVPQAALSDDIEAAPNQYIVKYSQARLEKLAAQEPFMMMLSQADSVNVLNSDMGLQQKEQLPLPGMALVEVSANLNSDAVNQALESGLIEYFEPNYKLYANAVPDDPKLELLWGMHNTGQSGGTADIDVDGPEVWDVSTGGDDVVIGVIDTGVDYTHEDLKDNMWVNPGEIADNGIDDDGNGIIDDIHGYNAINNSGDPYDDHYHGTHCAGTIAGVGNNAKGVVGVAWKAKIIGIKFLSSSGSGWTSDAVKAVDYAVKLKQSGVNISVLSNSWGGGGFSQALEDAISAANDEGIIFTAAAGNAASNNDSRPHYPSNYDLPNVISVAALHRSGSLAYFSNYGLETVHVAAPGQDTYSTIPNNSYTYLSGTSMATPHVSGVAALAMQARPELTPHEIRTLLMGTIKPIASLDGKIGAAGVVSAYRALTGDMSFPPRLKPIKDIAIHVDEGSAQVEIEASDPEGLPITYTAVSDKPEVVTLSISGDSLRITPKAGFLGSFNVTITVSNGEREAEDIFKVTVHDNAPPYIYPVSDKSVKAVGTLYFQPAMYDPNEDKLEVTANVSPSYAGYVYANKTLFYFAPAEGFLGEVRATITAADEYSTVSREFTITVHKNHPPKVPAIPDQTIAQSAERHFVEFKIEDEDNDYLRVNTELSLEGVAEVYYGYQGFYITPKNGFIGKFDVFVTVSDGEAEETTEFTVTVEDNIPPVIEDIPTQILTVDATQYIQIRVTDPDAPDYRLKFSGKIIEWRPNSSASAKPVVVFDESWSWIEVTAPENSTGVMKIKVEVSDSFDTVSKTFLLFVREGGHMGDDRDNDGVTDNQEEWDGTDPDDRGSHAGKLQTTVCAEWNGFFGGMWNVKEVTNQSWETIKLRSVLYDINGTARSSINYELAPGIQRDIIVQDMEGWQENSYGKVCTEALDAEEGAIDGRMVYYKPGSDEEFDFAFALPFTNGIRGPQFVSFNTFQPSSNTSDANNLVANWIQITNLDVLPQTGTLRFYDVEGIKLSEAQIELPAGARRDISAHELGRNLVGLVEWVPGDEFAAFQLRNIRYFYDNPTGAEHFDAAFQLEGNVGNGSEQAAPVDATQGFAVVELVNTLSEESAVDVDIYNNAGAPVGKLRRIMPAHSSWHIIANEHLNNEKGLVTVRGGKKASIISTVMQYGLHEDGSLLYLYGIQSVQSVGYYYRGSYNTFLGQSCELLLGNPSNEALTVSIELTRYDGTWDYGSYEETVPAHGIISQHVCDNALADGYGTVSIYPHTEGRLLGSVVRIGRHNSYRFPTPIRQ